MTRISKPKRGQRPTKRLDLTPIRAALADGRQWCALGVVVNREDGGPHWEIVGDNSDVMVEVQLQPSLELVGARLAAGMWIVPAVGDEVAVLIPAGEIDFMPVITCILAHAVPSTQGPTPTRIVIARGPGTQVLIHDGAGGAEELVKRSEFLKHGHATAGTGSPSPPIDVSPAVGSALDFPGTSVLLAK